MLFVDGIRSNDPAAGNEPRFELLNADLASRIEVVRGPQSALWGSEAIGGVVAVDGAAPGSGGTQAFAEGGSHDSWRGAAAPRSATPTRPFARRRRRSAATGSTASPATASGRLSQLGLRGSGRYRLIPGLPARRVGFALRGKSEFDGFDPVTFQRADTLDETRNRLAAGRLFAELGDRQESYATRLGQPARLVQSQLDVDDDPVNRTAASRRTLGLEGGHRLGKPPA